MPKGMQLSPPTPNHLVERPLWLNKKLWLRKEFWQGVAAGAVLGIIVMGVLVNRYTVVSVGDYYSIKLDRWTGQTYSVVLGKEFKNDQR